MIRQPVRTSLSNFIKTTMGSQFVIPVYQRTYTWTPEKETARYLDDLEDLLSGKTSNHFLGIIIYMDARISALFNQLQIVDGQQRMTTSFIFLLALRKAARERGDRSVAGMIEDYYLFNRHAEGDASFRLKPTVSNDDVFEKLIFGSSQDLTKKEQESSVYRNFDYICRRIANMAKKHSLVEILDTLSRVDVLEFPLSETDNAQQIFESINSTGAPLTSADLIRNYVLMNHTNEVQERYYRMYWKPMEKLYPQSRQLEDFFRYYLAVKTYTLYSRKEIYEKFKEYWNRSKETAEKKLQEINRYCRWCYDLYDGTLYSEESERAMSDYRRMNSRVTAPFFMDLFRLHIEEKISDHELAEIIRLTDSYIIRRNICGMDNGNLGAYFPTLLKAVLNAFARRRNRSILSIVQTGLVEYNKGKTLAMPRDEDVRTRLKEVNAYNLSCIRAVLERLEHDGATAKVDLSALNIEHIMPQHPNKWWKYNSQTYNEDDYTFCANLIGNLTLCAVYDNTRMGNEDFAFKKEVLSRTLHIRMNTEILNCDLWNRDVVVLRTSEMADRIVQLYPYAIAESYGKAEPEEKVPVQDAVSRPAQVQVPEEMEEIPDEKIVRFRTPTVDARAYCRSEDCIVILAGTTMKPYYRLEMKKNRMLFHTMKQDGVLADTEGGKVVFCRNAEFRSLSDAAGFLLHRGGENASVWLRNDGTPAVETPAEPTVQESREEIPAGRVIVLEGAGAKVRAVFENPKKITVLADSTMRSYSGKDMRRYRSLFLEYRARNELVHVDRTTVRFTKNCSFESLNQAAGFLLHRGGENSAVWTNENGTPITGKPAVQATAEVKKSNQQPAGIPLVLNGKNTEVKAVFKNPRSVVILAGSTMRSYNRNEQRILRVKETRLMEQGAVAKEQQKLTFTADTEFASLTEAASFILHKKGDHADAFRHADGRAITGRPAIYGAVEHKEPKVTVRRFGGRKAKEVNINSFAGTPFAKSEEE